MYKVLGCAVLMLLLWTGSAGGGVAAQAGDVAAVKAKFGSLNQSTATAQGWKVDALCVDATSFGLPQASGAMGFHAGQSSGNMGMAGMLDPLQPQELVFDAEGRIVAVEYQVPMGTGQSAPTLFGQTFQETPPHVGMDMNHWSLHLWFVPNPSGPFAMFNPDVHCPTGQIAPNINHTVALPGASAGGASGAGNQTGTDTLPQTGKPDALALAATGLLLALLSLVAGLRLRRRPRRAG
ncbi:MAG: hypothetical protein M3021_04825 [Actinomycetota bacterium]|nr:hypothetical protein [Actinomycetota bacterium]